MRQLSMQQDAALNAIRLRPGLSLHEVAAATHRPYQGVCRTLASLMRRGELVRTVDGRYWVRAR